MDNQQDYNALPQACTEGNLENVKQLLENGAEPNIKDNDENTSLYLASWNGYFKITS